MPTLLGYILLFAFIGAFFVGFHLLLGKLVRPSKFDPEKAEIYECGEPTVGTSWIQFDLRFYVVALLFVIFDVEMVFFFPWAVVFGKLNALASPAVAALPPADRGPLVQALIPGAPENLVIDPSLANQFAWITFVDILIFFTVLMVGFAYLWKRGDLNWVRTTAAEQSSRQPDVEKYQAEYEARPAALPDAKTEPVLAAAHH